MAVPELHFFSGNDVNGPTILEVPVTEDYVERLIVRPALTELGYMAFRFSRQVGFAIFDSGAFVPETFVRLLVPDVSATRYLWGCFLNDRVQQLVARVKAGENFDFGGPGPKQYLSRAILWDEQFFGSGYNIDLANGVYRWNETASAGRVLTSLINDDANNTIAEFLPDLTKSFGNSDDSAGVAWANDIAGTDEFELRIGDNFLTDLFKIEDSGDLETTMYLGTVASPVLRLDAWQGYGRDLSGAIGAATVHFKEAVNILGDLSVAGSSQRKASHALVEGLEGSYARAVRTSWDPGEYAKAVGISHDTTKNENVLERYGLAWLRRQANGENEILVPHYPGFSQSTGLYFPGPGSEAPGGAATSGHYWIGDTVSLTTGGNAGGTWTPLDYRSEDQRVMAITMEMRSVVKDGSPTEAALSWNVIAELNVERNSDTQPQPSGDKGGVGLALCGPSVACEELTTGDLTAASSTNGDAEDTGGGQWSGGAYQTTHRFAGSRSYGSLAIVEADFTYTWAPAQVFVAGTRYVLDIYAKQQFSSAEPAPLSFGVDGGDEELGAAHDLGSIVGADGTNWEHWRICWTPSADRTGVRARWHVTQSASGYYVLDSLGLSTTAAGEEVVGTSGRAARCDHTHHAADLVGEVGVVDHGGLTGLADDDHSAYETVIAGGGPTVQTHGAMGAAETINAANGNLHTGTLDDNCTVTVTAFAAGGIVCRFAQDAGGGNAITWSGVTFAGDDQPGQGANEVTEFVLSSDGTGVLGYKAGVGITDHGALTGLADDDHTQYTLKATLTTTGDIYYASSANTPARRAIGSSGDVLTVTGGVPTWAAPVGASGFHYEILMAAGTSPPEPLETGDGLDWLYVLVAD